MKYKPLFPGVLFLLAAISSPGQDSTLARILSAPDDTGKVRSLVSYTQKILSTDLPKVRELSEKILELSKQLKYNKGIGDAYSQLGYYEYFQGNYTKSTYNTKQAIEYYTRSKDTAGISKGYGNLALCLESQNQNDSGIIYRMKAINMLEKNPNRQLAFHYYNLAVQFNNRLENFDKALYYFRKSEEVATQVNDSVNLVAAWSGISISLDQKGKLAEAQSYAEKAIAMAKLLNDNIAMSKALSSYTNILLKLKKVDAALEAARSSVLYAEKAGHTSLFIQNSNKWAKILQQKGDYNTQVIVLEKALATAKRLNHVQHYHHTLEGLAEGNYLLGQYKKAYDYQALAVKHADSIRKERDTRILAELETKYETAQKEKALTQTELEVSKKEVQLQKSRLVSIVSIGAAFLAVVIALLGFFYYKNKRRLHQKQLLAIQKDKEIQLLQALMQGEEKERSRIAKDLHDGVAGMLAASKMHLNSLSSQHADLTEGTAYQQGLRLLDEAATEVRKTSHNLMPEVLLQYGLDQAIRRYCQNINNGKILSVQYDSWGAIARYTDSFELSVYRIVQELLNNIVKHSKASQAIVQLSSHDGLLSITIEDNGIGIEDENIKGGIGLHSLVSRVKAMNGKMELQTEAGSGVNAYLEFDVSDLEQKPAYVTN